MKITNFLVLSFLLFAFTATSIFPHAVHAEAVIDVFGDEVRTGDRYIIGAASNDFAVTSSRIICNSDVVFSPMSDGLPVMFSPAVESNDSVIHEDSYLNVDFDAATCRMAGVSTMWKIELRPTARGFVVTTGGVAGLNRFKITKCEGATSIFPHAVHVEDPEAVIDVNGNEVTPHARYFIGAASDDNTTTLAVSATSQIICNSDVILSSMSNGLPVTFSSPVGESDDGIIREDSYLNVNFDAATCRMAGVSTMWKMELRPTMRGFVVTTGGVDGLNRFKITKYEGGNNSYQLSYCPISDPMCECSCACVPLGNVVDRLAPSTIPFPVVFEPVADKSS
ncbi:hypothetical protein Peur_025788 [Populus x canadensis]